LKTLREKVDDAKKEARLKKWEREEAEEQRESDERASRAAEADGMDKAERARMSVCTMLLSEASRGVI
jgi:hypothetical protein